MAIYQYYLRVLPEKGLLNIHGTIPHKIKVSAETGYFETEANLYWNSAKVEPNIIIDEIDLLLNRATWGNDEFSKTWKTYTDEVDNDASIDLTKESGLIEEFSFRVDLRELNLNFLLKMIDLGKKYKWIFMNRKGILIKPEIEDICNEISNSNPHKFMTNPKKFLDNLSNGKIEIK